MPILLTSDRDGFAVTGPEALSLLAAECAVVDCDDGDAADPHHHVPKDLPMPRKYPWPCSKIDRDLMHELHCESKNGVPITVLIAEAVAAYLNAKLDEKTAQAATSPPQAPSQAA